MKGIFFFITLISTLLCVIAANSNYFDLLPREDLIAATKTMVSKVKSDSYENKENDASDSTVNAEETVAPKTKQQRNKKEAETETNQISIISKSNKDETDKNLLNAQKTWCNDNANFCNNICLNITAGSPSDKRCNYKTLAFNCICGNGTIPDQKSNI
ncbi:hypothetical protein BB561_005509 [Smittium simulii]|uniref:DUF7707 domain-containing protein n=1 Tax=Smittium simulii TaxID=133385 RepID=A0A2T9YA15_9FUNG|nr:hypothetical protein BB561_005509 [Smittium simulii]